MYASMRDALPAPFLIKVLPLLFLPLHSRYTFHVSIVLYIYNWPSYIVVPHLFASRAHRGQMIIPSSSVFIIVHQIMLLVLIVSSYANANCFDYGGSRSHTISPAIPKQVEHNHSPGIQQANSIQPRASI